MLINHIIKTYYIIFNHHPKNRLLDNPLISPSSIVYTVIMDRPISIPTLIPVSAIMMFFYPSFFFSLIFLHENVPANYHEPCRHRCTAGLGNGGKLPAHRRRKTLSRCNRGFRFGWIVVTEPIRRQRRALIVKSATLRCAIHGRRNLALTPSFLILEERLISRILLCLCRLVACYSRLVAILIA